MSHDLIWWINLLDLIVFLFSRTFQSPRSFVIVRWRGKKRRKRELMVFWFINDIWTKVLEFFCYLILIQHFFFCVVMFVNRVCSSFGMSTTTLMTTTTVGVDRRATMHAHFSFRRALTSQQDFVFVQSGLAFSMAILRRSDNGRRSFMFICHCFIVPIPLGHHFVGIFNFLCVADRS